MIRLSGTGVFNDDVCKELRHGFLAFNLHQAVPGIGIFRVYQIEDTDGISVFLQIDGHILIKLTFRIGDNQGFPSGDTGKYKIPHKGSGFHGTGRAIYGDVAVHSGLFRKAYRLIVQLSQNNAAGEADILYQFQNLTHLILCHEAGGSIGALVGIF